VGLLQLAQQFRSAREKLWSLVGEALADIENQFSVTYRDMGWFEISRSSSGIRKDVLESPAFYILAGNVNKTRVAAITTSGGRLRIVTRAEDDNAEVSLGIEDAVSWTNADFAISTIPLQYYVEFDLNVLAANLTVTSPVTPRPGRRLTIYVFAHPTTFYTVSFDSSFKDTSTNHSPDAAKATVYEFVGRSDGKWWPASIPRTGIDPT